MRRLRTKNRCKNNLNFSNADCGPGTIMAALEKILSVIEKCKLDEEQLTEVQEEFDFLKEKLSFTHMQSMVVAMLIDSGMILETAKMAGYIGIRNIKMLRYVSEIEELVKRRIVVYKEDQFESGYKISAKALSAYMRNEAYLPESNKNLSTRKLVDVMEYLMCEYKDNNLSYTQFFDEVEDVLANNKRHILCKKTKGLATREKVMFFICLARYVYEGDLHIIESDYMSVLNSADRSAIRCAVTSRFGPLFKEKLLGDAVDEGFAPRDACAISEEIREYIDEELQLSWTKPNVNKEGLLSCENIKEKALFYNDEDGISIAKLASMLQQENFLAIQERMNEGGVRSGFACLFYGAPGTGKTESVLQLARQTGRDIMQVNVASIKSKWVGESEKNVRGIFDRYRRLCSKLEKKPILLFNEADAIINKRSANPDSSVDKMNNAMQNIILEEIEKLDGILIATTNLAGNMDNAFERRFIYKVEFHKPDVNAKKNIWQSMIVELNDQDAMTLANEFDLSGGQIENVMRKQFVDKVLYNEQATLEKLRYYCLQEKMNMQGNNRTRIGF